VTREANTMPGSAGSSWYAVRYCAPRDAARFVSKEAEAYWMKDGVDLYLGGSEHAVGHLLYARFWQNVLFDLGLVSTPEPFRRLFHQGLITSFAYQNAARALVPVDEVQARPDGSFVRTTTGEVVTQITAKMSKSLKNVVNPDDVIEEFGADTFRLYEMYMGPLEASKPWNPRDITGLFRFLQRLWRLCVDESSGLPRRADAPDPAVEKLLHRTTAKVEGDVERLAFNTAIAALIEFTNAALASPAAALTSDQASRLLRLLSPFAPHAAEELWSRHALAGQAATSPWPAHDPRMLVDDSVEVPVSVMGKLRSRVMVPAGADAAAHEAAALADPKVQELTAGKTIKKVIIVPGKMINLVLG
jgi:leucyl-tRNA synthetase